MNKKMVIWLLATFLATWVSTACQLSPEAKDPSMLPGTIQDPFLQKAWLYLYQQEEPIELWDGISLTGRGLALFIRDHQIPVVWDTEGICGGASCSLRRRTEDGFIYLDSEAIYIRPSLRDDFTGLVGSVAHEAFHRLQFFKMARVTRYEEYWAYWVHVHCSGETTYHFDGYDPLVPNQLVQWFEDNLIFGYYDLQNYPPDLPGVRQEVLQAGLVEISTHP